MNEIKAIIYHPFFRIMMVATIVALLMVSCEYGPKHGKMNASENPFSDKFKGASSSLNSTSTDDFTESDLRYQNQRVTLSHEGLCWANCQKITATEIQEILDQEKMNESQSSDLVSSGECPTLAFEGSTKEEREIRVIIGDCKEDPKVVSVLDLKEKTDCNCD